MSLAFILTSTLICVAPGTGVLLTIGASISKGVRAGLFMASASTLGIVPHAAAALTGLTALLHAGGVAFRCVKVFGIGYLMWIAWRTWRDTGALSFAGPNATSSPRAMLMTGVGANLLNPKLTLFFLAFLPQFVPARQPNATNLEHLAALSAAFMGITFATLALYALAAGALRRRVMTNPRLAQRIRRTLAVSLVGLSVQLALE